MPQSHDVLSWVPYVIEEGVERPGRCFPAAVPVEPAIAYFGRLRFVRVGDEREIVEKSSAEIQTD